MGGACTPPDTETEACGKCGTRTRTCSAFGSFGPWSSCRGEGVCTPGDTDMTGCFGLGTRTCSATCTWGTCSGTTGKACADGTDGQTFTDMHGCKGKVKWPSRATLCGVGFHVCSADEWVSDRGGVAPSYNYWVDDDLVGGGTLETACYATMGVGSFSCTSGPMRVCAGKIDSLSNSCTWAGCGFKVAKPNEYFGGCNGAPRPAGGRPDTAGTLCCKT
jgi:hypothetical protein